MEFSYIPKGVCARKINFELDSDNKIHNVSFMGGCNGNLKAISKLVEGHDVNEIISILEGNICLGKKTSCADQFANALKDALNKNA